MLKNLNRLQISAYTCRVEHKTRRYDDNTIMILSGVISCPQFKSAHLMPIINSLRKAIHIFIEENCSEPWQFVTYLFRVQKDLYIMFQGSIYSNKRKLTKRIPGQFDLEVQFAGVALRKRVTSRLTGFQAIIPTIILPSSQHSQAIRFV